MPSKKRFRIGNMTVNLGKIDDALKYQPDPNCRFTYIGCPAYTLGNGGRCVQFTGGEGGCFPWTGGGCGVNFSTLPPTTLLIGTQDCNATGSFGDILEPGNIKNIKDSLINQLKEVEAYELKLEIQETPQTLEEINALEVEFENSLKELKELKKNF